MQFSLYICAFLSTAIGFTTAKHLTCDQRPFFTDNLDPAMPPPSSSSTPLGDHVNLSDILGRDRSINIFAGFTRAIAAISQRLENGAQNSTILAPINSAISALPRKPWEDVNDYNTLGTEAYAGEDGEERARKNMLRFVEAHIVPTSPWKEGEKLKTLGGETVWWENEEGIMMIQPGDIEVTSVPGKVRNGEIWVLKNVRQYV